MKKRLYILSLVFTFFISTTGLPVTMHLCKMIGASVEECDMCSIPQEPVETSCCAEETTSKKVEISTGDSDCCVEKFSFIKIEDEISLTVNLKLSEGSVVLLTLDSALLLAEKEKVNLRLANYNLPPPKFGKKLLQTIHQLKIDLPNC